MKIKNKSLLSIAFFSMLLVSTLVFLSPKTHAQSGQSGFTIELSPAKLNLTINPGETYLQKFRVGNYSGATKTFYLYTQDYTVINEEGTPTFFENANTENPEATKYALSQWLKLPTNAITLNDKEATEIEVSIEIPENAEAGGHYGAFFVQTESPEQGTGTAIGSVGRIASILLVNVPGDVQEGISIMKAFTDKPIYWKENPTVDFVTMLRNTGNVHGIPFGAFNITGGLGFDSKSVIYNQDKGAVLPGAPERRLSESFEMNSTGGLIPPMGKFTIDLVARYGTNNLPLETTIFFWVLPLRFLAIALLAILIVLFIIWRALLSFKNR